MDTDDPQIWFLCGSDFSSTCGNPNPGDRMRKNNEWMLRWRETQDPLSTEAVTVVWAVCTHVSGYFDIRCRCNRSNARGFVTPNTGRRLEGPAGGRNAVCQG